jgi:hypothetical protein
MESRMRRTSLRVGDIFSMNETPDGQSRDIHLTISHIEAYRRSMDEIDEGLTARLTLNGDGGDTIVPGTILNA